MTLVEVGVGVVGGGAVGKLMVGIDILLGSVLIMSSSVTNCKIGACNTAAYLLCT